MTSSCKNLGNVVVLILSIITISSTTEILCNDSFGFKPTAPNQQIPPTAPNQQIPPTAPNQQDPITLSLNDGKFIESSNSSTVVIDLNYTVIDSTFVGQTINVVMKVYSSNGTLLTVTSIPEGFTINEFGTQQVISKIMNSDVKDLTAVAQLTNVDGTRPLSNSVKAPLTLGVPVSGS